MHLQDAFSSLRLSGWTNLFDVDEALDRRLHTCTTTQHTDRLYRYIDAYCTIMMHHGVLSSQTTSAIRANVDDLLHPRSAGDGRTRRRWSLFGKRVEKHEDVTHAPTLLPIEGIRLAVTLHGVIDKDNYLRRRMVDASLPDEKNTEHDLH